MKTKIFTNIGLVLAMVFGGVSIVFGASDEDYIIGVGDSILVSVWRNPDLSITVPVRPDGKISTPLVGDMQAAGLTPTNLGIQITEKLAEYIREPQVSIILVGLKSNEYISRVRVTGAVGGPLSVPYRKGMTILDLVLLAGGVNSFGAPNRAVLYRTNSKDGSIEKIRVRLKDILEKGKLESNLFIQEGDVLTVPASFF